MNTKIAIKAAIIAAQIRERYPELAKLKLHPDKMAAITYAALVEGGWANAWDSDAWIIAGQVSEYLIDLAETPATTARSTRAGASQRSCSREISY